MNALTDKEFIADPDQWPQWPFLPLKRYKEHNLESVFLLDHEARYRMCECLTCHYTWESPYIPSDATPNISTTHCPECSGTCEVGPIQKRGPILFKGNIFHLPNDLTTLPKTEYESIDAVLADGWVVD